MPVTAKVKAYIVMWKEQQPYSDVWKSTLKLMYKENADMSLF